MVCPLPNQDLELNTNNRDSAIIDVNTILQDNPLVDAVWVKQGGLEEKIADKLTKLLSKTDRTTQGGYNYILYNVM